MTSAPVIRLHPDDGVLIARASLPPGTVVADGVTTSERIPSGHKVAIKSIAVGEPIRRYGQIIGFATAPIASVHWSSVTAPSTPMTSEAAASTPLPRWLQWRVRPVRSVPLGENFFARRR